MSGLLEAADRLLDVLDQENRALRRMDLPEAVALLGVKQQALARLQAETPPTAGAGPEIRAVAHRLQAASTENRTLLERAMTVQRRIMALLAQAAREQTSDQGYSARGRYQGGMADRPFALNARA